MIFFKLFSLLGPYFLLYLAWLKSISSSCKVLAAWWFLCLPREVSSCVTDLKMKSQTYFSWLLFQAQVPFSLPGKFQTYLTTNLCLQKWSESDLWIQNWESSEYKKQKLYSCTEFKICSSYLSNFSFSLLCVTSISLFLHNWGDEWWACAVLTSPELPWWGFMLLIKDYVRDLIIWFAVFWDTTNKLHVPLETLFICSFL